MSNEKPRRPFRFSLRTLLIVMTLFTVGIGWIAFRRHQTLKSVAEIEKLGGRVHVESAGLVGIVTVDLSRADVTDTDLEQMERLTFLITLILHDTEVTDAGLEHLKGLTYLRFLMLTNTKVTDAGVKKLQQALPNCEISH